MVDWGEGTGWARHGATWGLPLVPQGDPPRGLHLLEVGSRVLGDKGGSEERSVSGRLRGGRSWVCRSEGRCAGATDTAVQGR